jgi:autotransporter-associated beta strand protein
MRQRVRTERGVVSGDGWSARRLVTGTLQILAAACVAAELGAGAAEAATYRWNVDADGDWNNAANWTLESGTPNGFGYPNGPDDTAVLSNVITANRAITIPGFTSVTVGSLLIDDDNNYTIASTTGDLTFAHGGATATLQVTNVNGNGAHSIAAPLKLVDNLDLGTSSPVIFTFANRISNPGGDRSLTLSGPGVVRMAAAMTNTYTGSTNVQAGTLELSQAPMATAIVGPLVIGGAGQPATVRYLASQQMFASSDVTVLEHGVLDLNGRTDLLHSLTITNGTVTIGTGALTSSGLLTMTGGSITSTGMGFFRPATDVSIAAAPSSSTITGKLDISGSVHTFFAADGPADPELLIDGPVVDGSLFKTGPGTIRFAGAAPNSGQTLTLVKEGILELAKPSSTSISGRLVVGEGLGAPGTAIVRVMHNEQIENTQTVELNVDGVLVLNGSVIETIGPLSGVSGGHLNTGTGKLIVADVKMGLGVGTPSNSMSTSGAGELALASGDVVLSATASGSAIANGHLNLGVGSRAFDVPNGALDVDLDVSSIVTGTAALRKVGAGMMRMSGVNTFTGETTVAAGHLNVTGSNAASYVMLDGGTIGGTGTIGGLTAVDGVVAPGAPGLFPGVLRSSKLITLSVGVNVNVELNGVTPGAFDQLRVTGTVSLNNATLVATRTFDPADGATFTIIDNDGGDPVIGTFNGLPQGAEVLIDGKSFTITYQGGDGNDVVLYAGPLTLTYILAEGATGGFFDTDLLIANPNSSAAPITLTFLKEDGTTATFIREVPAQARLTVRMDALEGLEATAAATTVRSDAGLPLVVERTMFWNDSRYGGHTDAAVAAPSKSWVFGEGAQGFFDTYLLIANPNDVESAITLTFLREGEPAFVAPRTVGPRSRLTIHAGEYAELHNRSFGISVSSTQPVNAERATYFGSTATRLWSGGQESAGVAHPAQNWLLAEGATGPFFDTFILLGNAEQTPANVDVQFLLDTGETVTVKRTVPALGRVTIPVDTEPDTRLHAAAVSTVVTSDVPIVAERSMYWPTAEAAPWGEAHHAVGLTGTATRWGLAEGRVGGAADYATYILLANPSTTQAEVNITFLREFGAPIVLPYSVPPTSRVTVDVGTRVEALRGESFGATVEVTNGIGIAVERAMYWNAGDIFFAGGTNATATRLP